MEKKEPQDKLQEILHVDPIKAERLKMIEELNEGVRDIKELIGRLSPHDLVGIDTVIKTLNATLLVAERYKATRAAEETTDDSNPPETER